MYEKILLTLDGNPTDRAIIEHVKQLAKFAHSRLVLLHVADGWAARTYGPDAVSREITEDTAYLHRVQSEFQLEGILADAELAYGDPAEEIAQRFHLHRQGGRPVAEGDADRGRDQHLEPELPDQPSAASHQLQVACADGDTRDRRFPRTPSCDRRR